MDGDLDPYFTYGLGASGVANVIAYVWGDAADPLCLLLALGGGVGFALCALFFLTGQHRLSGDS